MSGACLVGVESFSRQRVGQMLWKVPSPAFGSLQMSITSPPALSLAEEDVKARPGQESRSSPKLPSQRSASYMNQTGPRSVLSPLCWLEEKLSLGLLSGWGDGLPHLCEVI